MNPNTTLAHHSERHRSTLLRQGNGVACVWFDKQKCGLEAWDIEIFAAIARRSRCRSQGARVADRGEVSVHLGVGKMDNDLTPFDIMDSFI